MRLLLDTQIFIWFAVDAPTLRSDARELITASGNTRYLSYVSLIEIAIKQKIGKLPALIVPIAELMELATAQGFTLLPMSASHITAYHAIPLMPNHRDPFDRLLLATALAEEIPIITADGHFTQYAPLVSIIAG